MSEKWEDGNYVLYPAINHEQSLTDELLKSRQSPEALNARIDELEAELKITDELLKEATETIGAVVACCTYNSNDDAKIGIYGIDQKAFTRIDQFITHYNDAVSAGKVSVDVKNIICCPPNPPEVQE